MDLCAMAGAHAANAANSDEARRVDLKETDTRTLQSDMLSR